MLHKYYNLCTEIDAALAQPSPVQNVMLEKAELLKQQIHRGEYDIELGTGNNITVASILAYWATVITHTPTTHHSFHPPPPTHAPPPTLICPPTHSPTHPLLIL